MKRRNLIKTTAAGSAFLLTSGAYGMLLRNMATTRLLLMAITAANRKTLMRWCDLN